MTLSTLRVPTSSGRILNQMLRQKSWKFILKIPLSSATSTKHRWLPILDEITNQVWNHPITSLWEIKACKRLNPYPPLSTNPTPKPWTFPKFLSAKSLSLLWISKAFLRINGFLIPKPSFFYWVQIVDHLIEWISTCEKENK